jgi:hypothetical protein
MDTSINVLEDFNQVEFHYIFGDNEKHSLDAFTRNACEKEFLNFMRTISTELGIHVEIDAEPKKEGSLVDLYSIFSKANEINIPAYASLVISIFAIIFSAKTKDEKRSQKLDNLIKQTDLIQKIEELKKQGLPIPIDAQKYLNKVCNSRKLDKQKSNFFKKLTNQKDVQKIEISGVQKELHEKRFSFEIPRTDFEEYYLDSDDLKSIIDNKAEIEVISPVLKNGNYSWRGIYLKENLSHEYTMKDKDFKKKVIEESLSFQNGTRLECELEICRKLDDNGDEYNSGYKINKVFNQYVGEVVTEMPSGKKRRQKDEMEKNQPSLFDENDFNKGK